MKRSFSYRRVIVVAAGLGLIAATYGLVRLAYGLYLPDVRRDLGLGGDLAGWISAGASIVYCLGAVVGFVLAARVPRALVLAAAVSGGGGALGMAAAGDATTFGVAAVLGSAGAGLASPALVRLVVLTVPEGRRDRAQAVVNAGTGPGLVVAGVLALLLLPDWRAAWAWSGVAALAVGAVLLTAARPAGTVPAPTALPPAGWWRAHRVVLAVALLFGAGSAVVWTYGRTALVDAGAPEAVSVSAWIALGVGGAAVTLTARWTDRLRARSTWAVTTGAVAVAVVVLGLSPDTAVLAVAACAVFGWGYTAATGALITWTAEVDADRAAAGTSVLFVALVAGQALGAAGAGALVAGVGTTVAFVSGAAVTAAATVSAWAGRASCTSVTGNTPRHDSGVMATKR